MNREVLAVGTDRRLAEAWVDVPAALHAGSAGWVPPLRRDALAAVDPQRNPLHAHADIEHFVLMQDGRPIGRIAATVHHAWLQRHSSRTGFFGFLDAPEDPQAFTLLTGAAEDWARRFDLDRVAGPYNYWSGQEMGLLLDRHDEQPALFQTWNPPGYVDLLQQLGYRPRTRMSAYRLTMADFARGRADLVRVADRVRGEQDLVTRPLSRLRFGRDMESVRVLFNAAFASSPEVVPYQRDVFASLVGPLRPLLDPRLVRFVERAGAPIGFSLVVPDLNQLLVRLGGRLRPVDLLRLPLRKRAIDGAVVLLVGVEPSTPLGAGQLLLADTLFALEAGRYRTVHTTWVHEENQVLHGLLRGLFDVKPHKEWALFERELAA